MELGTLIAKGVGITNKKLVFSLLVNIIVLGLLAGCLTIDVDLPHDDDEDHLVAYYFGTPPSIDGDLSEWTWIIHL